MEKKSISRSASLNPRALIALLLCACACFIVVGRVPAFLNPEGRTKLSERTLTFAERVSYQRAIEQVYWRHRIWPKGNPNPKPSLDAVMSQAQLKKKVEDDLSKSQLVADQRRRPITGSELQAEMDRMASHTKQPEVLRELFEALGNDPLVIAECVARPILAERLIADRTNGRCPAIAEGRRLFSPHDSARPAVAPYQGDITVVTNDNATYKLPEIWADCTGDTWTATTTVNAPDARWGHTAVWTGSEMIVWGGYGTDYLNTGGRYNPATDSWTSTSNTDVPTARWRHTAAWTGSEMIIWGGYGGNEEFLNDGGRYNPTHDTWTATSTANAPTARISPTAVWSGSEMIIWGGNFNGGPFNTGGRYNPNTDSWAATSTTNAAQARWYHIAIWTGSEMVVWGGTNGTNYLHTGGRYNPNTDSWTATSTVNVPLGRIAHTAIWTGSETIIWGGVDETFNDTNTGGRYDPGTDSWIANSIANAPSPRDSHTAVWTGSEMMVWGGNYCCPATDFNNGGRYDTSTDEWTATSTADAPHGRDSHTAVWTGDEMIVWGGGYFVGSNFILLNTGGRYCAPAGPTPTPTPTPSVTSTPTATPTATSTPTSTSVPRPAPTGRPRPSPAPRPSRP